MKKLSLLKLNAQRILQKEEKKRIRGGNCQSWACQCTGDWENKKDGSAIVDNTLDNRDSNGYI